MYLYKTVVMTRNLSNLVENLQMIEWIHKHVYNIQEWNKKQLNKSQIHPAIINQVSTYCGCNRLRYFRITEHCTYKVQPRNLDDKHQIVVILCPQAR